MSLCGYGMSAGEIQVTVAWDRSGGLLLKKARPIATATTGGRGDEYESYAQGRTCRELRAYKLSKPESSNPRHQVIGDLERRTPPNKPRQNRPHFASFPPSQQHTMNGNRKVANPVRDVLRVRDTHRVPH